MASTSSGLFRSVDCIRLQVADLARGLAFYRDALGHQLVWRTPTAAGLRMPDGAAELVIYMEGPGELVDLKVDDARAAVEAFTRAGGSLVVEPFDIPIGRCAVVRDPWGNELVLLDGSKGLLLTDREGNVTGVG
ncbi:MAG TPA: VOC family protein [Chloroflexota bacterium]|nr:VOC family protein [Chloroflexota bacterium]